MAFLPYRPAINPAPRVAVRLSGASVAQMRATLRRAADMRRLARAREREAPQIAGRRHVPPTDQNDLPR